MPDESRILQKLDHIDSRIGSVDVRLARMEVELHHVRGAQSSADQDRQALAARVDALEKDRDMRAGEVRAAKVLGMGGGLTGLAALGKVVWDLLVHGGGGQ